MVVPARAPSLDRPRPVLGLAHLVEAVVVDRLGVDLVERPLREVGVQVGERPFLVLGRALRDLAAAGGDDPGGEGAEARDLTDRLLLAGGRATGAPPRGRHPEPAPHVGEDVLQLLLGGAAIPSVGAAAEREVSALAVGHEAERVGPVPPDPTLDDFAPSPGHQSTSARLPLSRSKLDSSPITDHLLAPGRRRSIACAHRDYAWGRAEAPPSTPGRGRCSARRPSFCCLDRSYRAAPGSACGDSRGAHRPPVRSSSARTDLRRSATSSGSNRRRGLGPSPSRRTPSASAFS